MPIVSIDDLRRFAVARSFFPPTTLEGALGMFGFVQADPIRAPARAQDLTLRHRVAGYRAGDLERQYATLGIEEDIFVNYGFVTRTVQALMHPRAKAIAWPASRRKRGEAILDFIRARGAVHPREVDDHFAHGRVTNYWGGSSNATTHLLDAMHYRGLLRIVRRESGVRIYAAREALPPPVDNTDRDARLDRLIDVAVRKYAPLPAASLSSLVGRLRYGVPQWRRQLKPALERAKKRLMQARIEDVTWYWPADEEVAAPECSETVRLVAPFDPVVWDRRRFELLWGWAYRFEAYTPVKKRQRGYYALPLFWRDRAIGWGNISIKGGALQADLGYLTGRRPRDRGFAHSLEAELERMRSFLG